MDAVILGFGGLGQYLWEGNLVLGINLPGPKDISQGIGVGTFKCWHHLSSAVV